MDAVAENTEPRADVLREMRALADRGAPVREIVGLVQRRLGLEGDAILPVLWYFSRAFCLPLAEVLPLREWIGSREEDGIDAQILPAICRTRGVWAAPEE